MTVQLQMHSPARIMRRLGINAQGKVQRFHTANIKRRIVEYMPYRTGNTIKIMENQSPISEPYINVFTPYAKDIYTGVRDDGSRIRHWTTGHNPKAGPYWDRRLMQERGAAIRADLQRYINSL